MTIKEVLVTEEASRPVALIKFSFPPELKGASDIHSSGQLAGSPLNSFGRGVVGSSGEVKIGPIGSSHAGLSNRIKDPKRFYFGYSKELQTVYIVSKNGMDDSFLRKSAVLQAILSSIFDAYKLSIAQGKKLRFEEKGKIMANKVLNEIVQRKIGMASLEVKDEFFECSTKGIREAIQEAYEAGKKAASKIEEEVASAKKAADYKDLVTLKSTRLKDI